MDLGRISFQTPNRHGHAVRFAPWYRNLLACATSENYGISGEGTLFILEQSPLGDLIVRNAFKFEHSLYDVIWSEVEPNLLVTASSEGTLQFWNLRYAKPHILQGHTREVCALSWTQTGNESVVLSASWDSTVKMWDPHIGYCVTTFMGQNEHFYDTTWSPLTPKCFSTVSSSGMLNIWSSDSPSRPVLRVEAHLPQALACDWCKYDCHVIATGGSDWVIRGWDIRNATRPIFEQLGCQYAVRRVQFSPHWPSLLAAVSYDYTTRFWDYKTQAAPLETMNNHSEFAYGLDFSKHVPGQVADCGWDCLVNVYTPKFLKPVMCHPV